MARPTADLMAVLVTYRRLPSRAEAWASLASQLVKHGQTSLKSLLVYDNSPTAWLEAPAWPQVAYVHDPGNGGTGAAYAAARSMAAVQGSDWLLLLDQDTLLPPDFFDAAARAIADASACTAALLPFVQEAGQPISPARVTWTGSFRPLRPDDTIPIRITGIASGTILRVEAFRRIHDLPPGLWLDYVDHWIVAQLRRQGYRIGLIPTVLEHELSVSAPSEISRERLDSILAGEYLFAQQLPALARACYPLRLILRAARWSRHSPMQARRILMFLLRRR